MTSTDRISLPAPGSTGEPGPPPDLDAAFRRHADRLWAVALRMLGDPAEAEDAVQETFLAALRSPGFRGDADPGTWLHRILVNTCLDRIRSAARRRARLSAVVPDAGHDPVREIPGRLALTDALTHLPGELRAAVVLVDVLDTGVADAAAILGIAPATVKGRCRRGRLRLVELLGPLQEDA
ncbi:sigma-70 family RNA polymerase sigma factor [Pseudonocardia phyllosphaerae]|uniref:sigma-70 family RNA polymerase sigma factor n=1 Tax=Pseudonocardia phyllosphaerae TaxID=3390502 RepID=UPI00397E596C